MQLNKVCKGLLLALPMLAIAACSSKKNNDQAGSSSADGANSGYNNSSSAGMNSGLSSEDAARQQLQALQNKNIVYFGFDKFDVASDYADLLDQHAAFLRGNPSVNVTIEGHADERGTPEYNIALGERRATSVKMYLQSKGVPEGQISIVSYGKEKPAVLGHDENAYAKNRRAVLAY